MSALGISVWDLTRAEWQSRRQMRQIVEFLRRRVPGFERAYAVQSGVTVGVRETRRIVGEYQLTADDVLSARKFDDVIARSTYPIDIHNPLGPGTVLRRLPPGSPTTFLFAVSFHKVPSARWWPGGASQGRTKPIPPTGSCRWPWRRARPPECARRWRPARGRARGRVPAADVQAELVRQGASLR